MSVEKAKHLEGLLNELKSFKSKEVWDTRQFGFLRTEIIKHLNDPIKTKFERLKFYSEVKAIPDDDDLPF